VTKNKRYERKSAELHWLHDASGALLTKMSPATVPPTRSCLTASLRFPF